MPPLRRNGPQNGPGRRLKQAIPGTLVEIRRPGIVRNEKIIQALARTERDWKDCLRKAQDIKTPQGQRDVLEELYAISARSRAPIFPLLVQRWLQFVSRETAQQAYADFAEMVSSGKIRIMAKPSAAQKKLEQEQGEQEKLQDAYTHLNRLDVPEAEYGTVRAAVIRAVREGTIEDFLGQLEKKYPRTKP
jgi:hypothetical protein